MQIVTKNNITFNFSFRFLQDLNDVGDSGFNAGQVSVNAPISASWHHRGIWWNDGKHFHETSELTYCF